MAKYGTFTDVNGHELEDPETNQFPDPPAVFNKKNEEIFTIKKFQHYGILDRIDNIELVSKWTGISPERIYEVAQHPIGYTSDEEEEANEEECRDDETNSLRQSPH